MSFETPRAGSQASGSGRSDIEALKALVENLRKEVHQLKESRSSQYQHRVEEREGLTTENVDLPQAHQEVSAKTPLVFNVTSKNSPVQRENPVLVKEFPRAKYLADSPPFRMFRETGLAPSPAYQNPEERIWEQSYLSKALQNMKDSEIPKLKLLSTSDRPQECEKWLHLISTTMKGLHPEIGNYWLRVCESAEQVYQRFFLKDLTQTRISLLPNEILRRTQIETRNESRLKMMLANITPQ